MKIIQLLILSVYLVSCTQNKGEVKDAVLFTYKDFAPSIKLKGEILPTENLWKPIRIYYTDSVLATVDMSRDYFVQIYNKENLNLIAENVPRGIGPNERLNCWTLQINSDYIWTFDIQTQKMTAYSKDSFLSNTNVLPDKTVTIDDAPVGMVSLSNKTFVASCLADDKSLLSLYDYNGKRNNALKPPYPQFKIENVSNIREKRLFENRIQYNEENNKIVVFYVYTDIIEIYDENLNLLSRIQGPDHFTPELGIRDNFIHTIKGQTKFAYSLGCLTSTEIWALYYGVSPEKEMELPTQIFVFDYNGKPLRSYNLEYPISTFCIDDNNNILYGLSEISETCIVKFKY